MSLFPLSPKKVGEPVTGSIGALSGILTTDRVVAGARSLAFSFSLIEAFSLRKESRKPIVWRKKKNYLEKSSESPILFSEGLEFERHRFFGGVDATSQSSLSSPAVDEYTSALYCFAALR